LGKRNFKKRSLKENAKESVVVIKMLEQSSNGIPILAVIIEPLVALSMLTISWRSGPNINKDKTHQY